MSAVSRAFRVLGVTPLTPLHEVKTRYRLLVSKHHPDVAGGDENLFKEVTSAYDVVRKHLENPHPNEGSVEFTDFRRYKGTGEGPEMRRESMSFRTFLWHYDFWETTLPIASMVVTFWMLLAAIQEQNALRRRSLGHLAYTPSAYAQDRTTKKQMVEESHHSARLDQRRRTQLVYRNLREYFFVHDTESTVERAALLRSERSTTEAEMENAETECELVVYWKDLIATIESHRWREADSAPDIPHAMRVMAQSLLHVPSCHPRNFMVTDVEYARDDSKLPTKCLLRVLGSSQGGWIPDRSKLPVKMQHILISEKRKQ